MKNIMLPEAYACLNLYALESLYVSSASEEKRGIERTSGSVTSPALKAKQKKNEDKISRFAIGIYTENAEINLFLQRSFADSITSAGVF